MRKTAIGLGIALLTTASLAACGDNDTSVDANSASSSSSVTETSAPTTSTTSAGPGTQTSVPATSPKRFLVDVRALHVDSTDTLQFTFNEATPGYAAEYVTPPITDEGEGKPVAISGDNVVKLVFESAATVDLTGGTKKYYTGPDRFSPTDTKAVSEVVKVSEYEGRLEFGIGTRTKAPFTVKSAGNIVTISFG